MSHVSASTQLLSTIGGFTKSGGLNRIRATTRECR